MPSLYLQKAAKQFRKNWHMNRLSDKTFVETSSFFLCIPFKTTKPKSQPVIYYLKIIYKMFALFEGISNKLLVSFFLLLFFSFMKPMIHTSVLWRTGQWLLPGQPTSPAYVEKKSPTVNQVHSAKLGENICLAI